MKRFSKFVLVGLLVSGLTVDTATARRLFQRGGCCPKCTTCCPTTCQEPCPAPATCPGCDAPACPIFADSPCSEESVTLTEAVPCSSCPASPQPELLTEELPTYEPAMPAPTPADAEAAPAPEPEATDHFEQPTPALQPAIAPVPVAAPSEPDVEFVKPSMPAPSAPAPMAEVPTEDVPAAADVGDRYSNSNSMPAPAIEPPTEEPVVEEPVAEEPAPADSDDGIFDEPTPAPSMDDAPEADSSESEQPQTEGSSEFDDIFGPSDSTSDNTPADDTPADEAESPEETPDESKDDEPAPYDPFGEELSSLDPQGLILSSDGGLQSKVLRTWTDHSASFQCQARLVRVTAKNVVLQRATGNELKVPLSRLANVDLHFVHQQITALRIVRARDAAAEKLALAWSR